MVAFEQLRTVLDDVRIVHQISGRIRLRLACDVAIAEPRVQRPGHFDEVVRRIQGVRSVRANTLARSCIVRLLSEAALRQRLGAAAQESVRSRFLLSRLLEHYLGLFTVFEPVVRSHGARLASGGLPRRDAGVPSAAAERGAPRT